LLGLLSDLENGGDVPPRRQALSELLGVKTPNTIFVSVNNETEDNQTREILLYDQMVKQNNFTDAYRTA
jgi:hypothetical protein